jgi:hypothetical protein
MAICFYFYATIQGYCLIKIMTNLDTIVKSLKAEIFVDPNGECFLSARGCCRLLGVGSNQLSASYMGVELTETLKTYGFDPASFSLKGIPDTALGILANYYGFVSRKRKPQAAILANLLSAVGARVLLQQTVNWQPKDSIEEYRTKLIEFGTNYLKVSSALPKIEQNLSNYLVTNESLPLTYDQYIKKKNIILTRPQRSDFVGRLSAWCKANDQPPTKLRRGSGHYNLYDAKHFAFMDALLEEVLTTEYGKRKRKVEQQFAI